MKATHLLVAATLPRLALLSVTSLALVCITSLALVCITSLALPSAALAATSPAARPAVTLRGVVVDAESGAPLDRALVQQVGSLRSAFTDREGRFELPLDPAGRRELIVSAVAYDTLERDVRGGGPLRLRLAPIKGYVPPAAPARSGPPESAPATDDAPLNSGLTFAYRARHQSQDAGDARIAGWLNNDYRLAGRLRYWPWLLEAEGAHWETGVKVTGLADGQNPAFSPSTWQAGARVGLFHPFSRDLEAALAAGYRYTVTSPNNNGVRYTGSPLDHEQSRHAFGPVATVAYRPGRGRWHSEASLGLYPLVIARAASPGTPFGTAFLTDARAALGYEIVAGLRAGLGYQLEDWRGAGADSSHILSLQLHYTPGGLPRGTI